MRSTRAAAVAFALAGGGAAVAGPDPGRLPVMGGTDVPDGVWRDAGVVIIGGFPSCTGTLVAPTVALTAGHCNDSQLTTFWVGTNNLGQTGEGERLPVTRRIEYPDSQSTFDVTVLVLSQESSIPPRAIATGWARLDIANGAPVQLVGFGAIDRNASQYVDELQEAETTITDFDCTEHPGCNAGARPAGELGAGGMGIDTCPGDSGGPLYLKTSYGDFLAGVTSRAYADADFPCQDGGIYERPDAIVDWIEASAGVPVARGPEPSAPAIQAVRGDRGETEIEANDPLSDDHRYSIPAQPAHGSAAVNDDGEVHYCANADYTGPDTVTVQIQDRSDPDRVLALDVAVDVVDGTPPESCRVEFGGGCCSTGTRLDLGSAAPFVVAGAVLLLRRRKQR
jgi:endonuclease G